MALDGTYSGLQSSIGDWLNRSDMAVVIPDMITLFESTANTELNLRTRFNLTSATITTVGNTATYALPADFLQTVALILNLQNSNVTLTPQPLSSIYTSNSSQTSAQPTSFTMDKNGIIFAPPPDQAYTITHYYYQKVPALVSNPTGNWLLTNYPQVYLFGSLVAGEAYLGTDPRIQTWGTLYDNALQKLGGSTARDQFGASPLRVQVDTVV